MTNKVKKILVLFILALIGYNSLSSFSLSDPTDEELIIGIWINEDNDKDKWVFTNNGVCKSYYDGELFNEYSYTIARTSPQCGYQVRASNNLEDTDYTYLRLRDLDEEQYISCYTILGVSENSLSINYLGTTSMMVFDRQ